MFILQQQPMEIILHHQKSKPMHFAKALLKSISTSQIQLSQIGDKEKSEILSISKKQKI